jgi:hypothetical protein
VTGDVEVLGIIDFHSLMERHPVSEESLAKQMMMVEATSIASLDTLVETLYYYLRIPTHASITPLLKVVAQS